MSIPIIGSLLSGNQKEETDFDIPAPPPNMDISGMISQGYGESYFRFQQSNQQIESKEELLRTVKYGNLTISCKNALKDLILTFYDKNVLLSNLMDQNGAEIAYYYMLATIKTVSLNCSDRSDISRPEFIRVIALLQRQAQFIFSRAHGPKRERMVDAMINMGVESIQKISKLGKNEQEPRQ